MIVCHTCKTESYVGTLFCPECGARLYEAGDTTRSLSGQQTNDAIRALDRQDLTGSVASPRGTIRVPAADAANENEQPDLALLVRNRTVRLPLAGQNEFSLGRADKAQAVVPDIDLNPFGGYELGVSRIHASIQRNQQQITLTDLDSANGTYLNEQKLKPNIPYPLHNGDRIVLGQLEVFIFITPLL